MMENGLSWTPEFLIAAVRTSGANVSPECRRAMADLTLKEMRRFEREAGLPEQDPDLCVALMIVGEHLVQKGVDWAQWSVTVRTEYGNFTETFHELVTVKLKGLSDIGQAKVGDYLRIVREEKLWSPWR